MTSPCIGIGRLLGHKFSARHDVLPPQVSELNNAYSIQIEALAKLITAGTKRIYAGDVCTRCGQKVGP